ncbi:MAG: hypothetical protein IJ413_09155 [Bacteroides sp.]|nr:hypothetical protein [Bacteroides sp.]
MNKNNILTVCQFNEVNMVVNKKEKYCAKCSLKRGRGWTNKMISLFYPTPSLEVTNPHYATAPRMKLYKILEVERIEQTESFKNYWNRIAHKREVARAMMIERHRAAKAKLIEMEQHTIGMSNQRA